jgi:hypothetical protein
VNPGLISTGVLTSLERTDPMSLPTPLPLLTLNARKNETTSFIQDNDPAGVPFVQGTTTASVIDQNPTAGKQYTFAATVQVLSANRLVITVTATPPAGLITWATTNVIISTTTNGTTVASDLVPVILKTSQTPLVNFANLSPISLQLTVGLNSVVYLPVTGFGHVVTVKVPTSLYGTWTITARQIHKTPELMLTFTYVAPPEEGRLGTTPPTSGVISVTVVSETGTAVTVPSVPVIYVPDPSNDPVGP